MTCRDFEQLWQLRLDEGGFPVSGRELAHAAHCEQCRMRLEEYRLLEESLKAWRVQPLEVDLAERVTQALHAAGGTNPFTHGSGRPLSAQYLPAPAAAAQDRLTRGIFAILAAAASVTGITLFARSLPQADPPAVAVSAAVHETGASTSAVVTEYDAALPPGDPDREFAQRTRQAYGPVARRAAGAVGQVFTLIGPVSSEGPPPESPPGDSQPERLLTGLQQQFQPIGRGVGEALDFLWMAGERQASQ